MLCRRCPAGSQGPGSWETGLALGRSGSVSPFPRGFLRSCFWSEHRIGTRVWSRCRRSGRRAACAPQNVGRPVFEAPLGVEWPRADLWAPSAPARGSSSSWERKADVNVGRDCGQERTKGRWSRATCLGHRERTASVHPSSGLPRRGDRLAMSLWPPWASLVSGRAGTLNNSAGTTGREGGQDMGPMLLHPTLPPYLPGSGPCDPAWPGSQWPQGDCQDS